ncbi:hypothetical protein [Microlunatus speluncae]|uniref:hypothetical protein n=1 Tax=Microlunatus speluncae TaxID=2594267 RepID=UPI0013755A2F|nr:hypothetical protein [Microlunatus speluncae]
MNWNLYRDGRSEAVPDESDRSAMELAGRLPRRRPASMVLIGWTIGVGAVGAAGLLFLPLAGEPDHGARLLVDLVVAAVWIAIRTLARIRSGPGVGEYSIDALGTVRALGPLTRAERAAGRSASRRRPSRRTIVAISVAVVAAVAALAVLGPGAGRWALDRDPGLIDTAFLLPFWAVLAIFAMIILDGTQLFVRDNVGARRAALAGLLDDAVAAELVADYLRRGGDPERLRTGLPITELASAEFAAAHRPYGRRRADSPPR